MKGRVVLFIYLMSLILPSNPGFAANNSSVSLKDQQLLPVPIPPLHIDIVPNELQINASMRSGNYPLAESTSLQVTSGASGWYVQLQATSLKSKEDEISSDDIQLITKQETVSLNRPQILVENGQLGETFIDIPIELQTTKRYTTGTYVGELLLIAGYVDGPPPEVIKLPFEVEVTCSIMNCIRGNKMFFHYGLPGEILNAIAIGEISADTDICLSLVATRGQIDRLPMLKSISNQNNCKDSFIPLIWELRNKGTSWREPDYISSDSSEISWEMAADSKKVFYELQCSPRPDTEQAPGDYGMSVVLTIMPIL